MMDKLAALQRLPLDGRGEAFVEMAFWYPLLECLGYEQHKDYEVIVHGDDRANFKLKYPPVEMGAKAVRHYNPDYIPTIRKRSFWILEAKSPSDVTFPFEYAYLVQGLQYCIHPEIQAVYMVLSNGKDTCVYDPYSAAFLEGNYYEPILHFSQTHIVESWPQIHAMLSIGKLRERVEMILKSHYEKLAASALTQPIQIAYG